MKDEAVIEHPGPVFELKVCTMEHSRDKVCDGNIWAFTRGVLPGRTPSSGTWSVPMVCHHRHHFLVVVELTDFIQSNGSEGGISWGILGNPAVQTSHWWCFAACRDPPYGISLVISYDQVGGLSVEAGILFILFHIFGPLAYEAPVY